MLHNFVRSVFVKYQYKAMIINRVEAHAKAFIIAADEYAANTPDKPTHSRTQNNIASIANVA